MQWQQSVCYTFYDASGRPHDVVTSLNWPIFPGDELAAMLQIRADRGFLPVVFPIRPAEWNFVGEPFQTAFPVAPP